MPRTLAVEFEHGDRSGWMKHHYRGQQPCDACVDGYRKRQAAEQAARTAANRAARAAVKQAEQDRRETEKRNKELDRIAAQELVRRYPDEFKAIRDRVRAAVAE